MSMSRVPDYLRTFPTIEELGQRRRELIMQELPRHTEPETIKEDKRLREAIECFGLCLWSPTADWETNPPVRYTYWVIEDRLHLTWTPWVSVESLLKRIEIRDYCLMRCHDGSIVRRSG